MVTGPRTLTERWSTWWWERWEEDVTEHMRQKTTGRAWRGRSIGSLLAVAAALIAFDGAPVMAQQATLTLEDAVDLARRNNPGFLSTQNDQAATDWAVREAYGALIPTVNASTNAGYRGAGEVRVGTITIDNQVTDWLSSGYNINVSADRLNRLYRHES